MRRLLALLALMLVPVATTTACTSKENPSVTPNSEGVKQDTLDQVRGLQEQVRRYVNEFTVALGGASPNPGTVRIGPAPCSSGTSDIAENGVYYVAGGWQIPLAAEDQISKIRAVRDAWQAKGYSIVLYQEVDDNTRARLEGEDPSNGFTFSVISTNPPTAVGIRALSTCVAPPDGQYPGDGITIYQ